MLAATDSTVERVAIPWLHIIREHPIVLARYDELFARIGVVGQFCRRIKYGLVNNATWLRKIFEAVKVAGTHIVGLDSAPDCVDVLFVSYLLKPSQFNDTNEFYFASLPTDLAQDGISTAVAMINSSGRSSSYYQGKKAGGKVPRLVLGDSLSLRMEWNLHRRLKAESRRLARRAQQATRPLERRVAWRASLEALSSGASHALRIGSQIASLIEKLKPRALVVLHEGHAWERIAFAAARRENPKVVCMGYQHSALFRLQYAIRQQLSQQYMPDWVMASGVVGKSLLKTAPALQDLPMCVLGSIRAKRFLTGDTVKSQTADPRKRNQNLGCLVLPEGIVSECNILLEYSIECAKLCPDLKFIWRLHPSMTFEALAARNPKLRKIPDNIQRSKAPIERDLARCRLALYRGTTAIVQAVGAGLRPVYLRQPGEMTIDPLFKISAWRIEIETPKEFQELLRTETEAPDDAKARVIARKFCEQMFVPINRHVLMDALAQSEAGWRNTRIT